MPHAHQGAFQKLCSQIADLSHQTAAIVLGSFQDMALDCLHLIIGPSVKPTSANFENTPGGLDPAAACAKIMYAFSVLVSQPSIKCTFLSLLDVNTADIESLKVSSDSKSRYGAVADPSRAPRFLAILMHVFEESTDNSLTLQLQECIAQIFQSLLDSDINLCGPYSALNVLLANTIPSPKYLRDIAEALISHIGNGDHSMGSVSTALRALTLFSEFDYTMFHLKSAFNQAMKNATDVDGADGSDLFNLFARLATSFSKDDEYLALLHCSIDFINVMITVEAPEEEMNAENGAGGPGRCKEQRRYVFSPDHMKKLLKWEGDRESQHPLGDLEKLLHDYAAEEEEEGEETLQSLHETLVNILGLIFGDGAPAPGRRTTTNMVEVDLKEKPRTLEAKFTTRYMYDVTMDEDERMKGEFWDEIANIYNPQDDDLVKVDLISMAQRYTPGFDIQDALDKSNPDLPEDFKVPRKKPKRPGRDTINISRGGAKGKKFVAPMRGGRGGCPARSGGPGRQDPFRSRPPNTSRPPSMHVDDFLQMELDKIEKYEREKKEQEKLNLANAERTPPPERSPSLGAASTAASDGGASGLAANLVAQERSSASPARGVRDRESSAGRGGSLERGRSGGPSSSNMSQPPMPRGGGGGGSRGGGMGFRGGSGMDMRGRYGNNRGGSNRDGFRGGSRDHQGFSRGDSPPRGRGFMNDRGGRGGFHMRGGRGNGRGGRDFDNRNHSRSFTR